MEEFSSSREDEGILEDMDAKTEGSAVEVQAGATRPLSDPSTKKGADKRRYGGLKNDLGNNYLMGKYQYPDTTEKARVLLENYKPPRQQ